MAGMGTTSSLAWLEQSMRLSKPLGELLTRSGLALSCQVVALHCQVTTFSWSPCKPLGHVSAWWGGPGGRMVCHDVGCPHRHCLSPACLRWGDLHENVQDRVGRGIYLCAVLGRRGEAVAYTSELSWPCFAFVGGGWVVKCAKGLSLAQWLDIMCV